MSRTGAALVAAGLLVAQLTPILPATPAFADPNPAIGQCRELLPSRPNSNQGECISYINTAGNGSQGEVAHFCDYLEENDPVIFEMMFVSRTDCIHAYGLRGRYH